MKPIDTFRFLANNRVSHDYQSLNQCYAPIMGQEATSLYAYLLVMFDDGQQLHQFAELLNHLQYGMPVLERSLSVLMALNLLDFYQDKEHYLLKLRSPLTQEDFLKNTFYRRLLEHYIGEYAVSKLLVTVPDTARQIRKKFSDVFTAFGELEQSLDKVSRSDKSSFDMDSFKLRMSREDLLFQNETEDTIALCYLADKHSLDWHQTYQLAKETAISNTISVQRMLQKQVAKVTSVSQQSGKWTEQEQVVLREATSSASEDFLAKIKHQRQATVTEDEQQLLLELAQQGFLDEVINVMVLYTFNKTNSANLNRRYLQKIANDFAYQKVRTAEMAMEQLRAFKDREMAKKPVSPPKTNVPEWSNQDYQNQTSDDEQKRLEEIKRRTLEKIRKDGA